MVELWFGIFWIMVGTYLILDGRTLGASALRLFVSSSADERRQVLDAIGPIWSWYEVWFVGAGGVLLLAFPSVLAAAFSGYYLALFVILWLLVIRGISIEIGRHLDHPMWRSFWNVTLAASSTLLILLFGVAFGNIIRGVPLDEHGEFQMAFFTDFGVRGRVGLLDWYTLLVGGLTVVALCAHGATFLTSRATGVVREGSKAAGRWLWSATVILGIAVALATRIVRPDFWSELWSRPLSIAFLLIAVSGGVAVLAGRRSDRDGLAFAGSCALIAGILGARAAASFPILLFSTLDPQYSVSAFEAASQHRSLVIGLVWWLIAAPIALTWHALASRSFRGRIGSDPLIPLVLLLACAQFGCSAPRSAAPRPERAEHDGALTLTIENDTFTGSDNNYTNGVGLGWSTDEVSTYEVGSFVRGWTDFWSFLPFVLDEGYRTYASWTVGQEMHTPDDITDPDPPATDQPYAGVLYLDSVIAARAHHWEHRWSLRVGVVGPASQADNMQDWFHEVIGSDEPMGWDHQLPDEPLLNVGYDAAYMLVERDLGMSAEFRLVPVGGAAVGNYFTGASLGLYGEVGWNLVDAFGISALRGGLDTATTIGVGPVEDWSISFFGGVGGFGIAHYLPLDGTVFKDSRSVDSEPFVGTMSAGLTLRRGSFVLGLARTYTTEAFEPQTENAEYGTVSLSWFF